jgi:hypothetical protein
MAGILVPYDRFLEIRQRRLRVTAAIEEQPIDERSVRDRRSTDDKPPDPRARVDGTLSTLE